MTKTKHIVSLELSKKLKEAGYPQEGEFWWYMVNNIKGFIGKCPTGINDVVAPLACELIERLPTVLQPINGCNTDRLLTLFKRGNVWVCGYIEEGGGYDVIDELSEDKTICNVLAKTYLYLVEKGLLK